MSEHKCVENVNDMLRVGRVHPVEQICLKQRLTLLCSGQSESNASLGT